MVIQLTGSVKTKKYKALKMIQGYTSLCEIELQNIQLFILKYQSEYCQKWSKYRGIIDFLGLL